jgi:hypothetical protein
MTTTVWILQSAVVTLLILAVIRYLDNRFGGAQR